jgi:hypothetical protein
VKKLENGALFCKVIEGMGKTNPVEVRIGSLILFRHLAVTSLFYFIFSFEDFPHY